MLKPCFRTLESRLTDFPDWHHGRKRYAVWLLTDEYNKALNQKFAAARAHMENFLLTPYTRQPHITVMIAGFVAETTRYADDFTADQLSCQLDALDQAQLGSFEIEIGGLNSFVSAAYLEVHDPSGGINQLREVLTAGRVQEFRTTAYHPHLTVGLYNNVYTGSQLNPRLASFECEAVRLHVSQLALASYDAQEIGGQLTQHHIFCLDGSATGQQSTP